MIEQIIRIKLVKSFAHQNLREWKNKTIENEILKISAVSEVGYWMFYFAIDAKEIFFVPD